MTWCFAILGDRARKASRRTAFKILRSRWYVESTGVGQWVKDWNLGRVCRRTSNAIKAVEALPLDAVGEGWG